MAGLVTTLLGALRMRPRRPVDTCPVCQRGIGDHEERMRLPGGGYAHRGCSTYRMRRREQIRRRARVY